MGVGVAIKALLLEQGISIKQLSEKTGIPINTIYSITSKDSKNVRSDTLQKIAEALHVSANELLSYVEKYGIPETSRARYDFGTVDEQCAIEIMNNLKKLNSEGLQEANKQINNLTKIKDYTE